MATTSQISNFGQRQLFPNAFAVDTESWAAMTVVFSVLASTTLIGSALTKNRINATAKLYREQARATAAVRLAPDLTTIPSLTPMASQPQGLIEAAAL